MPASAIPEPETPYGDAAPGAAASDASLSELIEREISRPAGAAADILATEIRRRHGAAVSGVLFYGSCLRRETAEGVLDFYVLVDDYRGFYDSRLLAAANAALPPNVLWLEHPHGDATLRCKYAVMTLRDFARCAAPRGLDGRVWARFAQPAALVWARDEAIRDAAIRAVEDAVLTLVERMLPWMPLDGRELRFTARDLWTFAFRETYRTELRVEQPATIDALFARDPERYAQATRAALARLAQQRRVGGVREEDGAFVVESRPAVLRRARLVWRLSRPFAKALVVLATLKTTGTQDDWVSYVLWKLERHSGQRIEVTDAQRRHPLLLGWPVVFRLLRQGVLR
jgi:hypothetical protein